MPIQISPTNIVFAGREKIQGLCQEFLHQHNFSYFQYLRCYADGSISTMSQTEKDGLNRAGFHSAGVYQGIVLDLKQFNMKPTSSKDLSIKKVTSSNDFEIFCDIFAEVYQLSNTIKVEIMQMLNPLAKYNNFTHYLGYYQNEPVGMLTSWIQDQTVGLYNAGTLENFRNKGVLTTLINQALQDAKRMNCNKAVAQLMAKNMAGGVTSKLGFKKVCHFTPYVYGVNAEGIEPNS